MVPCFGEGANSTITTQFNAFGDNLSDGNQQTTTYQYDAGQLVRVERTQRLIILMMRWVI